jgi:F-type H+-transporting ATPase subunit gamma
MASARDIKKRIRAVGNIRRITKTMQMIATSKFAKAQSKATASKPYTEGIFELVTELGSKAGNVSHPLIEGPAGGAKGPEVVLVITSDRGLCGPYNGGVLRASMTVIRTAAEGALAVEGMGKKGLGFFKFNRIPLAAQHPNLGDKTRFDDIQALAQSYMDRFVTGQISGVKIVYMKYISVSRQKPEILQLLPLKAPAKIAAPGAEAASAGSAVQYEFSPKPEELLADLLPVTVKATLWQAFSDALVSEHVARMIAMKGATDNAGKMGKALTRKYNRARQAQITTELTEIISGAAALE